MVDLYPMLAERKFQFAKCVSLAKHQIGTGQRVFSVAEVGVNHNGDLGLGRELVHTMSEASADGVKFQNFRAEEFIVARSLNYTYESQDQTITVRDVLDANDVVSSRPGTRFALIRLDDIVGRTLVSALKQGQMPSLPDFV